MAMGILLVIAMLLMSGPVWVSMVADPIYQWSKGILSLAWYVDIGRAALTGALVIKVMTDSGRDG